MVSIWDCCRRNSAFMCLRRDIPRTDTNRIRPKPFTAEFPWADINELIAPDILHQVIKGTFKDHLVNWVERYLVQTHGPNNANIILDDIDRR